MKLFWWKTEGDYCIAVCLNCCQKSVTEFIPLFFTVDTAALCVLTVLYLTLLICSWCTGRESDILKVKILPMHLLSLCIKWHSGFKSSFVYSFIGMKWFYGKKNQLQREIDKRRHQDYVKAEDDRQVSECIFLSVYTKVHPSILYFAILINFLLFYHIRY